jgi:hypothetical protein
MPMCIIQVLLRPDDILSCASRLPPTGPGFSHDLIAQSDMLIVLSETSADGLLLTYEYRLFRLHRLLSVEQISCAHQNEPERRKKPLAAVRHTPAATPRPVSLSTALGDARRRSRGREVVMAGTAADDLEYAIRTINKLSAIVDRTGYGDEPEEADAAQRQGVEAIRRLRQLKTAPPPAADAVEQPAERTEVALAA